MIRLFSKLTGGRVGPSLGIDGPLVREGQDPARSPVSLSNEVLTAIESAIVVTRTPDEDSGPRVVVMTPALGGAFIFSREEAFRRVMRAFPELSESLGNRAVRYLERRVRLASTPPPVRRRKEGWVHGWKNWDESRYEN